MLPRPFKPSGALSLLVLVMVGIFAVPAARAQSPDFCSSVAPLQFPFWNDADGWSRPDQYETIQLADIDGDGQDELIARDSDGLTVQHWDQNARTWVPMLGSSAFPIDFSDAAGWNQPARYQSISFVDIDGDGKAELVALNVNNELLVLTYDERLKAFRSVRATSPNALSPDGQVILSPQTRFIRLGRSQPVEVFQPRSKEERFADFQGVRYGTLTASQLGSPTEATFTFKLSGAGFSDALTNFSYRALFNEGWFYSVSAGDLDGRGTAQIVYPTTSRYLNVFSYSPEGKKENLENFYRPQDALLLAFPADLRGNGGYDLVISDPDGLTPYRWKPGEDLKVLGEPLTLFAYPPSIQPDSAPLKFSSLQIANLRDGKGEVVLALLKDGLYAWGFNENTGRWEQRTRYTGISEDTGYGDYSSIGTLQTGHVRIDNQERTIVIARTRLGIRTAWYLPGPGFQTATAGYFPPFTGTQLTAYQYLSGKTGFSGDDIRSHYTNDYASIAEIRGKIAATTTPPPGVSQADFDVVRNQLLDEADAVDTTRRFFDRTDTFTSSIYQDQRAYFDTLYRLLSLKNSDPTKTSIDTGYKAISLAFDVISLFEPTGTAKTVLGTIKTFSSISSNIIWAADTYDKARAPGNLDKTVYGVSQKILNDQRSAREVNDCGRSRFLENWGLMKTLSDGVKERKIAYDSARTAALQRVYEKTFELELWQTLAPTRWMLTRSCLDTNYPMQYGYQQPYYPCSPFEGHLIITIPDLQSTVLSPPVPVPAATLDALLKGGYGVRKSDLFFGRNGWDLPIPQNSPSSIFSFEGNAFKDFLKQVPQGDSPVISPLTYDPTGPRFALLADASLSGDEASIAPVDQTTMDPATPPDRVKWARLRLTQLIDDVQANVYDSLERDYQTDLLNSALGFVKDEQNKDIAPDNAIAVLEDFQFYLEPSVQGESPDPVAERHMAEASRILNLLNVTGELHNAPLHHATS